MQRREADQRGREIARQTKMTIVGARAANDEHGRRRADERAEREELPRL